MFLPWRGGGDRYRDNDDDRGWRRDERRNDDRGWRRDDRRDDDRGWRRDDRRDDDRCGDRRDDRRDRRNDGGGRRPDRTLPSMLTPIVRFARSMNTLLVIVGGVMLMTRKREMM